MMRLGSSTHPVTILTHPRVSFLNAFPASDCEEALSAKSDAGAATRRSAAKAHRTSGLDVPAPMPTTVATHAKKLKQNGQAESTLSYPGMCLLQLRNDRDDDALHLEIALQ